jgi:hypothetical protein
MRRIIGRVIICALLIGGVLLSAIGYADRPINGLGMGRVSDANAAYIQQAYDRALNGFLILSGIKTGLAVIEGSEVGIGFSLEVGDVVQTLYDYVNIAWRTALAGGTVLLLTRLTLQTITLIDHWCLAACLLFALLFFLARWLLPRWHRVSQMFREAILMATVFSLALYFMLPFSIAGAAFLSQKITQPLIETSHAGFDALRADFSSDKLTHMLLSDTPSEDDSMLSKLDLTAHLAEAKARAEQMAEHFKSKTAQVATLTIKLIAGYLFDCIIFPLSFFLVLYVFAKYMTRYLLGIGAGQRVGREIEAVFKRYYGDRPRPAGGIERG